MIPNLKQFQILINPYKIKIQRYKKTNPTNINYHYYYCYFPQTQPTPLRPLTSEDFQAMIPAHFLSGGSQHQVHVAKPNEVGVAGVTVTVNKAVPDMPMFPAAPTELGRITETITKSTFTETVMTRVTDNHLAEPLISEVIIPKSS